MNKRLEVSSSLFLYRFIKLMLKFIKIIAF